MFSNILNGIPVVGHIKGYVHTITGDRAAARKAMSEATRSSLVIGGGIIGLAGGPAGAVAGAMAGGALNDSLTSIATGRPQGLIKCVDDIGTDINNGNVPVGPILNAGLLLGADAVSGLGAGAFSEIAKSVSTSTGKSVINAVAKETVKKAAMTQTAQSGVRTIVNDHLHLGPSREVSRPVVIGVGTMRPPSSGPDKPKDSDSTGSQRAAGSGAGQPPRDNEDDKDKKAGETPPSESHMAVFLRIFGVESLEDVEMGQPGVRIFRGLAPGQLKNLKKVIRNLRSDGYLEAVIETVMKIFSWVDTSDVTFQNFLSLVNLVAVFIGEAIAEQVEANRNGAFQERRQRCIGSLLSDIASLARKILDFFKGLRAEFEVENAGVMPRFRDVLSAVSHWYKHRVLPDGAEISVANYFRMIKRLLEKLKGLRQYLELTNDNHPRREIVYEIFCPLLQRRIRIVVKVQGNNLELSSCYVVDVIFVGDNDGDEFIDGQYEVL